MIALHCMEEQEPEEPTDSDLGPQQSTFAPESAEQVVAELCGMDPSITTSAPPQGKLIIDATVAPQNITYSTDLKLLCAARRKSEQLIDLLCNPALRGPFKPRTYRNIAQKLFLNTAKKKVKSNQELYKSNGRQLRFLRRNVKHIETLIDAYSRFPLTPKEQKYLLVLHTAYE